ncbi:M23 family metallopeptidase [Catenovulum sediminis]|uniref:M23 family metallopeptidase n=1 Tax=Catenovulum sediminis TaxID=1740262 RepID=A0ABV1RLV5_9ALTE
MVKAILKLSLLASICLLNNSYAQTEDIKGYTTEKAALVQGGFVRGQYQSCVSVTVKDTQTEQTGQCTDDGHFLIGFGRDADTKQTLIFETTSGQKAFTVEIKKRTYKTDKITGVPQKTVTPPDSVLARIRSENEKIWVARHHKTPRRDFLSDFIWPAQGRISGVYGSQRIFNGTPKRPHYGLDIAAITGTKVIAPAAGIVRLVHNDMFYSGGTLIVDHGFGITSTFIHLSKIDVIEGQIIKQGEKIAEIGQSGRASGPHLDWRINWFNVRLDPKLWLEDGGNLPPK